MLVIILIPLLTLKKQKKCFHLFTSLYRHHQRRIELRKTGERWKSDAHSLACPQSSLLSLMDRLSELPESILLHILSFLDMKDVVKTAILSKHWRNLWTIVPTLDFVNHELYPYRDFADFVNRTLLCRGNSKIRRLRIGFFLNDSSRKDYDGWILYAAKNNVEELFLEFHQDCCYWFPPQCVYRNSSLKTLSLSSCKFTRDLQITWNSLTKLTLSCAVLGDQDIHKIMVGAPKLEVFNLNWCWGYDNLNLDSPSLSTLIVCELESLDQLDYGPIMRISAPKVQSLELSGSLHRKCILMNVSSVVHATVDFRPRSCLISGKKTIKWQRSNIMEVFRCLKHVESLTLGPECIEVLALKESRRIPYQITTHKCVTLRVPMTEDDLLGTVNLLKGSPALQTLIIDMRTELYDRPTGTELADSYGANYLASQAKHIKCLLHNLKTVKITQFVSQHSVFPFLEFILMNGRVLENLVIITKRGVDANSPESLLKVAQRLLSLPRASSQAVVTLLN
ncbi:putative F-box protein At1g49610 isoform X2 [Lycium ferocissimum]|uniref:putative F-box protein At1g49610 isoform X2 n=1 Tax=Lycium ferocissimum TaxID=112874 RepID=UPI002814FBD5|nr:putative F-box protein At1g49610 isoform X2 [Lycium ferocissimum]